MLEITTALSGVSGTLDLLKTAVAARDAAKIEAALQDMSSRLTEALMSGLASVETAKALQAKLVAAERKNAELEKQLADQAMYELHELRPGAFAYRSKPALDGREAPTHYLCQPCRDQGIKTLLRKDPAPWAGEPWTCPANKRHDIG